MNVHRRQILSAAGLGLSGLYGLPVLAQEFDCFVQRLPGAQLYTVRDAMAENPDETLAALANIGIREVELVDLNLNDTFYGLSPLAFRSLLDLHGLEMTCANIFGDTFDVVDIARRARVLGIDTVILAMLPGLFEFSEKGINARAPRDLAELDDIAAFLNDLGRQFRRQGLFFAYHNHHVEFMPVEGEIPFDYLLSRTDPQLVRLELDIGWMALMGVDYLGYLGSTGPRVLSCHLRDFNGVNPADLNDVPGLTTHLPRPGAGTVNFEAVLRMMDYFNIRHGYIEFDRAENPLTAVAQGHRYLQALRNCD